MLHLSKLFPGFWLVLDLFLLNNIIVSIQKGVNSELPHRIIIIVERSLFWGFVSFLIMTTRLFRIVFFVPNSLIIMVKVVRLVPCWWCEFFLLVLKILDIVGSEETCLLVLQMMSLMSMRKLLALLLWRGWRFVFLLRVFAVYALSLLLICWYHLHKLFVRDLSAIFVWRTDFIIVLMLIRIIQIIVMHIIVLMQLYWRIIFQIIVLILLFFLFYGRIAVFSMMHAHFNDTKYC